MKIEKIVKHLTISNTLQLFFGVAFYIVNRIFLQRKIFIIASTRIGHLAADMDLHFLEGKHSKKNIYIYLTPICNKKLFEMCTFGLRIHSDKNMKFFLKLINSLNLKNKLFNKLTICNDRDVLRLRKKANKTFKLNENDRQLAQNILEENGFSDLLKHKLILLNVRDGLYLKTQLSHVDFSYHDYRNSDIKTYNKMVCHLLSEGFSVIRMGRNTFSQQDVVGKLFWDYSHSDIKCDLLDIYLAEICYACISTGSGYDALATINHKPVLYVNYLPHGHAMCFADYDYTCFKKLKDLETQKIISDHEELYSRNVFNVTRKIDYEKNGFEIVNLSETEILECVKYFIARISDENRGFISEKSIYEQKYLEVIKNDKDCLFLHGNNPIVQLVET